MTAVAAIAACNGGKLAPNGVNQLPPTQARPTSVLPVRPTLPAVDSGRIDMSDAGLSWTGFSIAAPEGTTITAALDGPEVVVVTTPAFSFELHQFKGIQATKEGLQHGAEEATGKVTFTIDTPDELAFMVETLGPDGKGEKGYGYSIGMQIGKQTYGCTALLASEAHVVQAKAICNSLANN